MWNSFSQKRHVRKSELKMQPYAQHDKELKPRTLPVRKVGNLYYNIWSQGMLMYLKCIHTVFFIIILLFIMYYVFRIHKSCYG